MPIITISRQFGTGGEFVAEKVAKALDYKFVSKEIIKYIAILSGVEEDKVKGYDEESHSTLKAITSKFIDLNMFKNIFIKNKDEDFEEIEFIDEKGTLFNDLNNSNFVGFDSETFAHMVEKVLYLLSNEKNAVVLGRGGQCIFRNKQDAFHIRLVAPFESRVEWLKNRQEISEKEAQSLILETDKRKEKFIKHYFNSFIDDFTLYHMVINLEKSSIEDVTRYIINAIKIKFSITI
jgi:cytidylate kinase